MLRLLPPCSPPRNALLLTCRSSSLACRFYGSPINGSREAQKPQKNEERLLMWIRSHCWGWRCSITEKKLSIWGRCCAQRENGLLRRRLRQGRENGSWRRSWFPSQRNWWPAKIEKLKSRKKKRVEYFRKDLYN